MPTVAARHAWNALPLNLARACLKQLWRCFAAAVEGALRDSILRELEQRTDWRQHGRNPRLKVKHGLPCKQAAVSAHGVQDSNWAHSSWLELHRSHIMHDDRNAWQLAHCSTQRASAPGSCKCPEEAITQVQPAMIRVG